MRVVLEDRRKHLESQLEARGDAVPPATRAVFRKALVVVDATIEAIREFELIVDRYAKRLDQINASAGLGA
jgi:hypothetical protein